MVFPFKPPFSYGFWMKPLNPPISLSPKKKGTIQWIPQLRAPTSPQKNHTDSTPKRVFFANCHIFFYISKKCIDMSSMNVSWLSSFTSWTYRSVLGGMDHSTQNFWHLFQHSFPVTLISKDLLKKNEVIEMRQKRVVLKYFFWGLWKAFEYDILNQN